MSFMSRILVVDDEPEIVQYLEYVLRGLGYQTASAYNGVEALEKAVTDPPDLVLLDVTMPIMDGFAVCPALREREATRLVPVVVMTALQGVENRIKAIEHGADEVLSKPVDERELIARVQGVLSRKNLEDSRIGALTHIRDHFAKFVPEAVRRQVLAHPEAPEPVKQERDVSVLFVAIGGYAQLAARVAPEKLNALVEHYFSSFLDRITDAGGDINETSGDGFMAIFQGDPVGHTVRAVDAALMLLAITEALNQKGARPSPRHPRRNRVRAGARRLHPLRGPTRVPLDLHGQRHGDYAGSPAGGRGRRWGDPGRAGDGAAAQRPLSAGAGRKGTPEEPHRGRRGPPDRQPARPAITGGGSPTMVTEAAASTRHSSAQTGTAGLRSFKMA